MNCLNKTAMDTAISQPHVLQNILKDYKTMETFSMTRIKNYNLANKITGSSLQIIGDEIHHYRLKNALNIKRKKITGQMCGVGFENKEEFEYLQENIPINWRNYDVNFDIKIWFKQRNPNLDSIAYICNYLNNVLKKSSKIRRLNIFLLNGCSNARQLNGEYHSFNMVATSQFLLENIGESILRICYGLKSNLLSHIRFSYINIKTITHLYSSRVDESKIKMNLPNLKDVALEKYFYKDECYKKKVFIQRDYDKCYEIMKNSKCNLFKLELLIGSNEHVFSAQRLITLEQERNKNAKIPVRFYNYETMARSNHIFARYNVDIELRTMMDHFLNISLRHMPILNNLTFVEMSMNPIQDEVDLPNFETMAKRLASFPKCLKSLLLYDLPYSLNKLNTELAEAYPKLKELSLLHLDNRNIQDYDKEFFASFENLEMLHLACLNGKEFIYPPKLRVLHIECRKYEKKAEELPTFDNFELFKSTTPAITNFTCNCHERKQPLKFCLINYLHTEVYNFIHLLEPFNSGLYYSRVNLYPSNRYRLFYDL
uniref:F-box domain-containing protein n=1 Tax=Rhabditophanes sp. KR3021 TaxID=114890 RepID=A0AC35TRD4_9BILA